jgi:hypothetical protein
MRSKRSAVSIKLVVSGTSKESRIALVGRTGKELLASATFTEPRAKGATLRALKKIFGSDIVVEDPTTTNGRPGKRVQRDDTVPAVTVTVAAQAAHKGTAAVEPLAAKRPASAVKTPAATKTTRRTPPARSA